MPAFTAVPGEGMRIELEDHEAQLLRELLKEMRTLLEADIPRADPVLQRLFPDAYEDPQDASKYRDLIGDELSEAKKDSLRLVAERLGASGPLHSSIPDDEIPAWLALLTDLRLAIGTRLDVTEQDMEEEPDPSDPDARAMAVLHWLGWLQGTMLEEMEVAEDA